MSIKQAIEALEGLDEAYCRAGAPLTRDERTEDRQRLINARAALAALRSMPQGEPVPIYIAHRSIEWLMSQDRTKDAWTTTRISLTPDEYLNTPLYATPHTEAVRMSEAEIEGLWSDCWDDYQPGGDKQLRQQFARAVEQATAARLGVKMGDV